MATPSSQIQEELSRLGAGGATDKLRFRLVLKVMARCLPLLKTVGWHLVGLVVAGAIAAVLLIYPVTQLYDLFLTRALKGDMPTMQQCALLAKFGTACEPWTPEGRMALLRGLVLVSAGLAMVFGALFASLVYYRIWILQRINQVLRVRLHDRYSALSLRFHNQNAVGDGIYRMYQDSAVITQLIDQLIVLPALHIGRCLFATLIILQYDKRLALAPLLGWVIALVIGYVFSRPMRVAFRAAREHNSALTSMVQASMQGVRVIKAYGAERKEQARFEALSEAAFARSYLARRRLILFSALGYVAFATLTVVAVAIAAMYAANDMPFVAKGMLATFGFTAWNLGLWSMFSGRISDSTIAASDALDLWGKMQDTAIGLDRVFEVLDLEPEVKDAADAVPLARFERAIDFEGVSFSYESGRPVLEQVQLSAAASTITALVGPTGSGKSTLMALLLRLYDADEGSIRIDGVDIRKLKIESLRSQVAIALQENMLFGTTIRENIRYAVPDASDEAVREAARVAVADEFIDKLERGYDTLLGERGSKLSTGQRQRLSIARALLKNSPILILDEPTAALDAQTELRVLENLASWGKGRAVFIITHRLSTIRRADQVVYIESGRVLERGPHDALMAKPGGAYRRLVEGEEAAARAVPQATAQ